MLKVPLRKNVVRSMIIKEFKQILRDFKMRGLLFGSPIFMLMVFGYAVNTDVKQVKMAVYDEDRSAESRTVLRRFTASGYFQLHTVLAAPGEGDLLLDRGRVDMIVHLPRDFSRLVKGGKQAAVQVLVDGTDSNRAAVISSYAVQILSGYSAAFAKSNVQVIAMSRGGAGRPMKQPVILKERALFNPALESRNFYLPGVLALLLALITVMLTSMSVVKEREAGTMEQIIVSPLSPLEFIVGKTAPFAIVGLVDICVITFLAIVWFKVPFRGNFALLLVTGFFYILSTLAVGLYISTVSRTQQQAMLSTFLFFIPSLIFSGFVFPIYAMPKVIQILTYANPIRYFITIVRGIFLKGVGPVVLWPEAAALVAIGTILFALSARRFGRRME